MSYFVKHTNTISIDTISILFINFDEIHVAKKKKKKKKKKIFPATRLAPVQTPQSKLFHLRK